VDGASFPDGLLPTHQCEVDWGDGTSEVLDCAELDTFSHAWSAEGSYVVRLRVKNAYGAEASATTTISF
jgi:hypothetical protein